MQTDEKPMTLRRRPFLRKNLLANGSPKPDLVANSALEIKVCMRTYRLFFVSGSEDSFARLRTPVEYAAAARRLSVAQKRRREWLANTNEGRNLPADV
jgi:paired amphipathic helix protein Sin3a